MRPFSYVRAGDAGTAIALVRGDDVTARADGVLYFTDRQRRDEGAAATRRR